MDNNATYFDTRPNPTPTNKRLYIATDGSLKQCITGPLLELPVDFKEWPKTDTSNILLFPDKAA